MPGAPELLKHFHKAGVPIAIATSSDKDLFMRKASKHGTSLANSSVTGDRLTFAR